MNTEDLRTYLESKGYNVYGATVEELDKMYEDDLNNYRIAKEKRNNGTAID